MGFSRNSVTLMKSYLCNPSQRTNVNNNLRSRQEILIRVLLGSIQDPIFNIFITDVFSFIANLHLANYTYDHNLYTIFSKSFFFFTNIDDSQGTRGRGRLTLYMNQAITAKSSPLHIASSCTRIGNLWFWSASP